MSVVGLTLGRGAKATRPSAASAASVATSASTRGPGCERSYHAKRAASATASTAIAPAIKLMPAPPRIQPAGSPRHRLRFASPQQRRPLLGSQDTGEDAGDLRGEVPAAAENLRRGGVRDRSPVAQQHG